MRSFGSLDMTGKSAKDPQLATRSVGRVPAATRRLPDGWRRVRVGDVLRQVDRFEAVDPLKEYPLLGIKWYAGGVFERERKLGRDIAAKELNRLERGDFVYNRLFAWKGSFAVADDGVES